MVLPEDTWNDGLDDELLEGGQTPRRMIRAQKHQEQRKKFRMKGEGDLDFGAVAPALGQER